MRTITKTNTGVELEHRYETMEHFLESCVTVDAEAGGKREMLNDHLNSDRKSFRGLSIQEIKDTVYGYAKGVDELVKLTGIETITGGSKFVYKWDEYDGDDMSMERYYEGMPSMRKRYRTSGNNTGRFVDIYVNICENAGTNYEDMLWKTYASVKIIDELESMGIRTSLYAATKSNNSGVIKHEGGTRQVKSEYVEVKVKDYNSPVNLGLFCSVLSPWFFRYWFFAHTMAKYSAYDSLGSADKIGKKGEQGSIYIDNRECLSQKSAEEKIKSVSEMLNS
jgi:hypothetical protein